MSKRDKRWPRDPYFVLGDPDEPRGSLGDPDSQRGPHFMLGDPEFPWWRPALALLFPPAVLVLLGVGSFLGAMPVFIWLSFFVFSIAYIAFELIAIWKLPSRRGW